MNELWIKMSIFAYKNQLNFITQEEYIIKERDSNKNVEASSFLVTLGLQRIQSLENKALAYLNK